MSDKLESKDLIESLGYKPDDFKTIDEFREKIGADWIRKANAEKDEGIQKAIIGTLGNRLEKTYMNAAKEFGVSLTDDDFKDAKYSDEKIKVVFGKFKNHFDTTTGELKKQVDAKGKEFNTELQGKLDRLTTDYETLKGENARLDQAVKDKDLWANNEIRAFKINDFKSKAKEKVNGLWKDSPSEFEKIGFQAKMDEKYDVDVDEKEGLIVFEKATKKRIPNPAVVNSFMTYEMVMEMELKAAGLDKKNPHKDQKPVNPFAGNGGGNGGDNKSKFPVNPAFYKKG